MVLEWAQHPVSKKMFYLTHNAKDLYTNYVINGSFSNFTEEASRCVGYLRALDFILNLDLVDRESENNGDYES